MSSGRPVARLVSPVIVRLGVMTALMAAIAVLGVVLSTRAVDYLTHELQPAAAANQNVFQDLTDMSAAVEAWSSTGSVAAKDDYEQALLRLPADQQRVRQFAAGDNQLELLVVRQDRAAQQWITTYAAPRMQTKGGTPATPATVREGSQLFNAIRSAHQETTAAFDRWNVSLMYGDYAAQPEIGFLDRRQGVYGTARVKLASNWAVFGGARYDINAEKFTATNIGLGYIDDCLILALNYMTGYSYSGPTVSTNHQIMLQLSLRTLGTTTTTQNVSSSTSGPVNGVGSGL